MNFDASFEALVRNGFAAALAAGQPDRITQSAYSALDQQPTAVIALGKAAGAMAVAVRNRGYDGCLLYTSPSPRDGLLSRMPSSA